MRLAIFNGEGWKFSAKSWQRFLNKWGSIGVMPELSAFATKITASVPDMSDWTADEAVAHLSGMRGGSN